MPLLQFYLTTRHTSAIRQEMWRIGGWRIYFDGDKSCYSRKNLVDTVLLPLDKWQKYSIMLQIKI
jgi:hypothetical protein